MKDRSTLFLILAIVAAGIAGATVSKFVQPSAAMRYQFVSNQGVIYRCDTARGQVERYDGRQWIEITGDPFAAK